MTESLHPRGRRQNAAPTDPADITAQPVTPSPQFPSLPVSGSASREEREPDQPFTRSSAYVFLLGGYVISLGIGLFIGWNAQDFFADLALLFRHHAPASAVGSFSPAALIISDLLFYPPIAVLIIDTLHAIASRIDTG